MWLSSQLGLRILKRLLITRLSVIGTNFDLSHFDAALVSCPSIGFGSLFVDKKIAPVSLKEEKKSERIILQNGLVHYELSHSGALVSMKLKDKESGKLSRELMEGKGNIFNLYDDVPLYWDAWDVEIYHLLKFNAVGDATEVKVLESGPLRATVQFKFKISEHSSIVQQVSLSAPSARLDFKTQVTWKETHKFLKVEFPVAIRSTEASYEVPFGFLSRPTHFNTTQDVARFEVCGHRWADLSEFGIGVALLNDSKYGYACHRNILRLSLLRSPTRPDATADHGVHDLAFSVLPHFGTFQQGRVIQEAHQFNSPLVHFEAPENVSNNWSISSNSPNISFFKANSPNVFIETIKQSEDNADCIVARLYEAYGSHCDVEFSTVFPIVRAEITDILEQKVFSNLSAISRDNQVVLNLTFRPLQVVTLKLWLIEMSD
jgi:alpha-mannosidase